MQFNHGRLSHRLVLRLRSRVASRKERGLQTIDVFVIFSQRVLQTRPTNHMTPDRAMGNALKSRHTRSINGRSRLRCSNCIPPVAPCFIQRRFISLQSDFFFLCSAIYFCESAAVIYRVYSFSLNFFSCLTIFISVIIISLDVFVTHVGLCAATTWAVRPPAEPRVGQRSFVSRARVCVDLRCRCNN